MSGTVLLVDDDEALCRLLTAELTHLGRQVTYRTSGREALAALEVQKFDAVVTDLEMGDIGGLALCRHLVEAWPDVPVLVLTAHGSFEMAVEAIRAGAYDFITKPPDVKALDLTLSRAVQLKKLKEEVRRLRDASQAASALPGLIGQSEPMRRLTAMIGRVAPTGSSVLITGESGTGKELVARALHDQSSRRGKPFVVLNCGAIPEALLESELFGHKRGAFTDARADRTGLFVEAEGGTLFLDEVGELPMSLQPKLLRALQERKVRPVGGPAEVAVDVRIVAATNRDLEGMLEGGRFREDLFFRLNVIQVELPPLRARSADILLIAQHFVERYAQLMNKPVVALSARAGEKLVDYPWPGNVRELQNCIERAVALTHYDRLSVEDLPERVRRFKPSHVVVAASDPSELVTLEVVERRYIERVLQSVGGNKTQAAKVLGLDRTTLYRKLERFGLSGNSEESS